MLGYYNRSVILTYLSLVSAVVGCGRAMVGEPLTAVVCLCICGICDMFDGAVARATKRSEEAQIFGIQIDSLCDLVAFGVLPAILLMSLSFSIVTTVVSALFVLGAVIRLGYFNVHEQIRQQTSKEDKCGFRGLPVTCAAWLIPTVYLLRPLSFKWFPAILTGVMLVIAVLFVLDFPLNKPKRKWILYAGGCAWLLILVTGLTLQWYL